MSVAAVTIRASRGCAVAIRHRASMHALPVEFHRMREWNLVPREKLLVAVTRGASVRQIFLGYRRGGIARGLNLVHRSVAGETVRCVRIAGRSRLSMDALLELLHLIGMALRALRRRQLRRGRNFVVIAVAGLAGYVAEHAVNAIGQVRSFIRVARCALNLDHFRGVRKVLDCRVAIGAA